MIDKYRLILDNDSDDSIDWSKCKTKITFYITKTRKGKPSKPDLNESDCEILCEMWDNYDSAINLCKKITRKP